MAMSQSLMAHLGTSVDLQVHLVESSREATSTARHVADRVDVAIAVGGDGTVADVATGIFGTTASLGIVPAGSTNIVARSLGIPGRPAAAMDVLAGQYQLRPIDVGRSGERSFLHIGGVGFDAEIFRNADPAWKRRLGWLAYLPAAAAALRIEPFQAHVTVDEVSVETRSPMVLVANGGAAVAPAFKIYPGIAVDDGWLDVLIFTATTTAEIAATLGLASRQRLDRSPHVIWRRGKTVAIETSVPVTVQLDGDVIGATPREFQVVPAGMFVVTPYR